MEFTSQICTTKEQSKRLLDLGVKAKTADMYHYVTSNGTGISAMDDNFLPHMDTLAWSLHRLIELLGLSKICLNIDLYDSPYEEIIRRIDIFINTGVFNREYLEEKV